MSTENNAKSQPPVQYLRLRETHPVAKKFQALMDKADELGISIYFSGMHTYLKSKDHPDLEFEVQDLDSKESVSEFPIELEYKIIYINPEYLNYCAEEAKKYQEQIRRQIEAVARIKAEKERIEQERKERILMEQELAELKRLKDKYEQTDNS